MIGIICALDKELLHFEEDLQETSIKEIMGYTFKVGKINNHEVVLTKCGMGKVAAGIVCTLLIEHFKPTVVINSGIAGGFKHGLKPLDILNVTKVGCYDIDMVLDGTLFGSITGEPRFLTQNKDLKTTTNIKVIKGTIMSADCFQSDRNACLNIFEKHFKEEDVIAVDMESYSIALICDKYHIDWCIVRAISDIIGEESQIDSYQGFANKAANNAYLLIKENYLN